jgi:hypothetical protein
MAIGFLSPLLIPLVTRPSLGTEWKTAISGLLLPGIPEVFAPAVIAVMGSEGFLNVAHYSEVSPLSR